MQVYMLVTSQRVNSQLSEVTDNLPDRCFDWDVHRTARRAGAPTATGTTLEVANYTNYLLRTTNKQTTQTGPINDC